MSCAYDVINLLNLVVVGKQLELPFPSVFGKRAVVLADEHDQVLGDTVRHFDGLHSPLQRQVVPAQIVDFAFHLSPLGSLDVTEGAAGYEC